MLSNLVYVSARKPNCTPAEIEKILDACNRNNQSVDITGVLLYSDTRFVQYLEGEYKLIFELYDKIKLDDRHKNVILITSGPINERTFPSWQMGSKKVDFNNIDFRTEMDATEKSEFQKLLSGNETKGALSLIKKVFK